MQAFEESENPSNMSNSEIQVIPRTQIERQEPPTFGPTSLREAIEFAERIATSNFIPKAYQGKPGDILAAVQMGAELKLPPMQALKSIAVINGTPSLFGDGFLAVIMGHPAFEWIKESDLVEIEKTGKAVCTIKRRGMEARTVTFTLEMAEKAGLTRKEGPWQQYRSRQMQFRARGFCGRDTFPDALRGTVIAEEAADMPMDPEPQQSRSLPTPTSAEQVQRDPEDEVLGKEWATTFYRTYSKSGWLPEESKAALQEVCGITDSRLVTQKHGDQMMKWASTPKPKPEPTPPADGIYDFDIEGQDEPGANG